MLADGMRNASIRYDRNTIQITTATTIEVSHPLSFDRKARTCSRTTGAPPPPRQRLRCSARGRTERTTLSLTGWGGGGRSGRASPRLPVEAPRMGQLDRGPGGVLDRGRIEPDRG